MTACCCSLDGELIALSEQCGVIACQVTHLYLRGDETYTCATDGTSSFNKCNALNFSDVTLDSAETTISQQEVLDHFDVEKGPVMCIIFLVGLSIVCRLLAYLLLRAQTNGFEGCDCAIPVACGSKEDGENDAEASVAATEGEEEDTRHEELVP